MGSSLKVDESATFIIVLEDGEQSRATPTTVGFDTWHATLFSSQSGMSVDVHANNSPSIRLNIGSTIQFQATPALPVDSLIVSRVSGISGTANVRIVASKSL